MRVLPSLAWMLIGWALASSPRQPIASSEEPQVEDEAQEADGDDDSLFDVLMRTNEGVISNIDTDNAALLAVLGAALVVLVFGIDKVRELTTWWKAPALTLLGLSAVSSIAGFCIGIFRTREPIDPDRFIVDFAADPSGARAVAARGAAKTYYRNAGDRRTKRWAIVLALVLLIVGIILVAVARSTEGVVYCAS